jgi:uncharacterized membrane protein YfcA
VPELAGLDLGTLLGLLATGAAAGFLSTTFGIGGGILMVPVLHYGFGVSFPEATALSLLAMCLPASLGVYQHARRGAVDWRIGGTLAGAGLAGVALGIWLQPRVPTTGLKLLFAVVLVTAAWRLALPVPVREGRAGPVLLGLLGAGAGVASKLLGIGGGLVTVPVLTLSGVPVHTAVGSSLVPVFTNAAVAGTAAVAAGLDGRLAVPLALASAVAGPLGTRLAHGMAPLGLRRAFAGLLVFTAAYVAATSGAF